MRNLHLIFFAMGIVLLLVACTNAHQMTLFGYSGSIGPWNWGSLSPFYSTCSKGKYQSPIDILKEKSVVDTKLTSLDRDYNNPAANATLINNGFNIMLKYDSSSVGSVLVEGKNYSLRQMHWHTPSEHTIDGQRFAAELQLVHISDDENITVVSILYKFGDSDKFLAKVMDKVEELKAEACSSEEEAHIPIDMVDTKPLRRNTRKYYRYVGSLTTPPCTENVVWSILGKVREIGKDQVKMLEETVGNGYHNNSRPTQPLNGRKVSLYAEITDDSKKSD